MSTFVYPHVAIYILMWSAYVESEGKSEDEGEIEGKCEEGRKVCVRQKSTTVQWCSAVASALALLSVTSLIIHIGL